MLCLLTLDKNILCGGRVRRTSLKKNYVNSVLRFSYPWKLVGLQRDSSNGVVAATVCLLNGVDPAWGLQWDVVTSENMQEWSYRS